MNNTGLPPIGSRMRHAMTQWLLPLYEWVGVGHPRASLVVMFLIGGVIFGGMWYLTGREYQETLKKSQQTSVSASPAIDPQQQRVAILSKIVTEYQGGHNMQMPTFEWINKKLKEQGADFRVNPPAPRPGAMVFHGGKFEGNGIAIDNRNPNAQFVFDGTDFINNKKGIVNVPPAQQEKKKERKP